MENSSESELIQREFGHCIVYWEIENFGFAAHGMEYEIKSETFSVRPHMTTWRMALKSEEGLCDDHYISFSLERMVDSGPDKVYVSMDVCLLDQDGKERKAPHDQYRIGQNDSKTIRLSNIYFGKVNLSIYNFNSLTVQCRMIVHEGKTGLKPENTIDYGIRNLALDMEQLYANSKFTDVKLNLGNPSQQLVAHKAILSARSEILKDVFSRYSLPTFLCPFHNHLEARQVLRYLYSGDVRSLLDNPSIAASDYITAFSLYELDYPYMADEQTMKTRIDVHQSGLMWEIEDFSKIAEESILSSVILGDMVDVVWQLRLYPRGIGGKEEYLTVIAESIEGKIDGNVWAKVEFFHDPYDRVWKTMNVVKEGELFELQNFESRDSVLKKLVGDTLRICFKACVSTGVTHSTNDQLVYPIPNVPKDHYYKKLSKDIFSLRGDARFADIVLYADGKEFKAHKLILSIRSSKFPDLTDDINEDKAICIDNVKAEIVEIVLDYIYSGILQNFEFDKLLEVFDAAWKIGVNDLIIECSRILSNSVNEGNVFKLLMTAYDLSDNNLKDSCLKFLSLNVPIRDETLKKIELENPTFSVEIENQLKALKLSSNETTE